MTWPEFQAWQELAHRRRIARFNANQRARHEERKRKER